MKLPPRAQHEQFLSFSKPARLFLLAVILDGVVYSAWSLFFNFYILERGYDREFLGLVTTTSSAAALLLGVPLGMLSDRIGRRAAMMLGVALYVAASGLEVTLPSPALILLMAFTAGAAYNLFYISQAPFMMQASTAANRTLLFSLSFGVVTLSGAVGSLFAGQLPALFGRLLEVPARSAPAYQAVLLAAVAMSALTLIPLAFIREPGRTVGLAGPAPAKVPIRQIITRPFTLRIMVIHAFIGFGAAILIPYMNVFFYDRFAISDQTLGLLFSLTALLTGIGSIIGPRLAESLGSKIKTVAATQGASLVFLGLMGFSPLLGLAAVGLLIRSMLMNMAVPLFDAFTMEHVEESARGTVNSLKNQAWWAGWAVGPYISGVVQEAYGFTPLFITTGILYAAATLMTWIFFNELEARDLDAAAISDILP